MVTCSKWSDCPSQGPKVILIFTAAGRATLFWCHPAATECGAMVISPWRFHESPSETVNKKNVADMWQTVYSKGFIWLYMAFYGFMMFKLRLVLSSNQDHHPQWTNEGNINICSHEFKWNSIALRCFFRHLETIKKQLWGSLAASLIARRRLLACFLVNTQDAVVVTAHLLGSWVISETVSEVFSLLPKNC